MEGIRVHLCDTCKKEPATCNGYGLKFQKGTNILIECKKYKKEAKK